MEVKSAIQEYVQNGSRKLLCGPLNSSTSGMYLELNNTSILKTF